MGSSIHNLIKSEYDKRQKAAYDLQQQKIAQISTHIPRVAEIEREIQLAGLKNTRLLLTGALSSKEASDRLQTTVSSLKADRERLLVENNYPPDYLNMVYTCPKCKDTGIISGEGLLAESCSCYKQQRINLIHVQSNIRLGGDESFNNFNENFYPNTANEVKYGGKESPRSEILRIKKKCMTFIENFDSSSTRNMLFSGPAGVGKTFMAICTAVELMNRGYTVLYQSAPVLFNTINEYRFRNSRDEDYDSSVYRNILDAELLIVDDLSTESPSAAKYAELLTILDGRAANNLSRPCKTIISTNIDMRKLYDYYDERVASRIMGNFEIYRFSGEDIRNLKRRS